MNPQPEFSLLLASSVHDIKNSVGVLLASLDDLLESASSLQTDDKRRYAILKAESARINHDLIALLGLYRLQDQQLSIHSEEVMVLDFLEEQVLAQQLLFDIHHIEVAIDCEYDLTAWFDQNLVAGVIGNALVNAVQHTKDRILLRAQRDGCGICLEVCDNGSGFDSQLLEQVGASDRPLNFASGNTSLGLYFARVIAAMHRQHAATGSVTLSNRPEGGACFQLRLP